MRAFAEVIGTATGDASPAVLLFFDDARYVFNAGDGTQRYCNEAGIKVTAKLRTVLLTGLAPPAVGGLLGLLLTAADAGMEAVSVVAPVGLRPFFDAARPFYHRPALATRLVEVAGVGARAGVGATANAGAAEPVVVVEDANVVVTAVPLVPLPPAVEEGDALGAAPPPTLPVVIAYIARLRPGPGKFDAARAAALGVPPGPDRGRLVRGEAVTVATADGGTTTVSPADVLSPPTPGPVVVVLDIPSMAYLPPAKASAALAAVAAAAAFTPATGGGGGSGGVPTVVFHMGPADVVRSPAYTAWATAWGAPAAAHVGLGEGVVDERPLYAAAAEDGAALAGAVSGQLFPLVVGARGVPPGGAREGPRRPPPAAPAKRKKVGGEAPRPAAAAAAAPRGGGNGAAAAAEWTAGAPRLRFMLAPAAAVGLDWCAVPPWTDVTASPFVVAGLVRQASEGDGDGSGEPPPTAAAPPPSAGGAPSPLESPPVWSPAPPPLWNPPPPSSSDAGAYGPSPPPPACLATLRRGDVALRVLGTGACLPGKHRNVSGSMLHLAGRGNVLLDAGEGTYGQLVRALGRAAADAAVAATRLVFISHLHADHHLGLLSFLHRRRGLTAHPLLLVGPAGLDRWLRGYFAAAAGGGGEAAAVAVGAAATTPGAGGAAPTNGVGGDGGGGGSGAAVAGAPAVRGAPHPPPPDVGYLFTDAAALTAPPAPPSSPFPAQLGLSLVTVPVDHCPAAYGVTLTDTVRGWSFVYSGDTRPCAGLAAAGAAVAPVLALHEATLDDALSAEAAAKAHCTTGDALGVCAAPPAAGGMGAYRTLLTHFSQRYGRVPTLTPAAPAVGRLAAARAAVAFDHMLVDWVDLPALPATVGRVARLFRGVGDGVSDAPEPSVAAVTA